MARPGPVTCPRCGRRSIPDGGPFCPYCGRYLAALTWVAEPPGSGPAPVVVRRPPYTGPPRYRVRPRGGYPALPWSALRPPVPPGPGELGSGLLGPGQRLPDALTLTRSLAATAVPALWATAAVAAVAAGAETWRYVLLVLSRGGALSAAAVAASDALVLSAGWIAPILTLVAGGMVVLWSVRASRAAADRAGVLPSRRPRSIVAGWLVPGVNLAVPGAVLAEIEHAALGLPASARPRPSRPVLVWWALWVAGVLLAAIVLLAGLRTGIQARADGVLLRAVLDLLAAVTAGATAVVVARLTRLLTPVRGARRELLVRVGPAPEAESAADAQLAQPAHDEVRTPDRVADEVHAG